MVIILIFRGSDGIMLNSRVIFPAVGLGQMVRAWSNSSASMPVPFLRSTICMSVSGGQVPLYRRLPKRGFNNFNFTTRYEVINVSQLDRFEDGAVVDAKCLFGAGLISSAESRVKLLGDGELTKKLDVNVHKFSKTAHDKILSCGGVAKVVA